MAKKKDGFGLKIKNMKLLIILLFVAGTVGCSQTSKRKCSNELLQFQDFEISIRVSTRFDIDTSVKYCIGGMEKSLAMHEDGYYHIGADAKYEMKLITLQTDGYDYVFMPDGLGGRYGAIHIADTCELKRHFQKYVDQINRYNPGHIKKELQKRKQ